MSLLERNHERYSKHMAKKTSPKKSTLTLHGLLGALSFWGTATRTFLFSFLAIAVLLVALTETNGASGADTQVMTFIYVIGCFVLLDFGYVLISRVYLLQKTLDVLALIAADIMVGLLYIVPKVVVDGGVAVKTDPLVYALFIPLVVLAMRALMGMLFGGRQR